MKIIFLANYGFVNDDKIIHCKKRTIEQWRM